MRTYKEMMEEVITLCNRLGYFVKQVSSSAMEAYAGNKSIHIHMDEKRGLVTLKYSTSFAWVINSPMYRFNEQNLRQFLG